MLCLGLGPWKDKLQATFPSPLGWGEGRGLEASEDWPEELGRPPGVSPDHRGSGLRDPDAWPRASKWRPISREKTGEPPKVRF